MFLMSRALPILIAAALAACAAAPSAPARAPLPAQTGPAPGYPKLAYKIVEVQRPYIALTFDDGPSATETPRLLDMLARRKIHATFFVVGRNVVKKPEIVRREVAEGHEIGNHSWSHARFTELPWSGVRQELLKTHQAVIAATGVAPRLLRPPFGKVAFTEEQEARVYREFGYKTIYWFADPYDWKEPGSKIVAQRILSLVRPGAIILAHDIHKGTVDAMPEVLDRLLAQGYKFVTVSELIALEKAEPTVSGSVRPGPMNRPNYPSRAPRRGY